MRIEREDAPFGLVGDRWDLIFTKQELAALRRASALMAEARDRCASRFGSDWVDSDADDILAHGEHAFADFIEEGRLEVWNS